MIHVRPDEAAAGLVISLGSILFAVLTMAAREERSLKIAAWFLLLFGAYGIWDSAYVMWIR